MKCSVWLRLFSLALLCNVAFSQSDGLCSHSISSESASELSYILSSDGQNSDCTRDAFCDVETSTCVCNEGFIGDGVTCTPVTKCKLPGKVRNGTWSRFGVDRERGHFYPGDRIKYSCKLGYAIKRNNGRKIRTCLADGSWDLKQPPACVVAKCDAPDGNITNGNSTAIPGTKYPRGGIIEYSCIPGYRIKGSPWQSCVSIDSLSGRWSNSPPTCEEIQCHDIGYPENSNRIGRPPFFVGDEVRFRCVSGYTLIGSELRTCQENGKWSGYLTICDSGAGDCLNPGIPINGRKEGRSYNLGDVVSFRCNTGFSLIGSKTRMCLDTGEWSGRQPTCRGPGDYDDPERIAVSFGKKLDRFVEDTASKNTGNPVGRVLDLNYGGRLEIYIAIDGSASVTEINFKRAVEFAKVLVKKTGVSGRPKGPRYGGLTYTNEVVERFHVTQYTDRESVIEELDRFQYPSVGGTGTANALKEVHTNMIPTAIGKFGNDDKYAREPPKRVLILLTDGASNTGGDPITAADKLKKDYDVEIYVIGIGVTQENDELLGMASTDLPDEHIFILDTYRALERLATLLVAGTIDYSECGMQGGTKKSIGLGRISGGVSTEEGAWPWQAALWTSETINGRPLTDSVYPFCGGSVISLKWILTAAHCFYQNDRLKKLTDNKTWHEYITVGLGYTNTETDGNKLHTQRFLVKRIITHEQYSNLDYDIALLELYEPIKFSNYIKPICLPNKTRVSEFPKIDDKMAITGWGNTKQYEINVETTLNKTTHLQQVYLNVIGWKNCAQDLDRTQKSFSKSPRPLTKNMFCVGGSNPSSCKGDSGGPVVKKVPASNDRGERWVQFGIVSFGYGCGVQDQHDVMTNITEFMDWIESYISH